MTHRPDRTYTFEDLEAHCLQRGCMAEAERCAAYRSLQTSEAEPPRERPPWWEDEKRDPYAEAHGFESGDRFGL